MSIVGENIKKRRKALGLSQAALANRALVSQSAISDIENPNVTKLPNVDTIGKIARVLGCTVDDLMGADDSKKQETPADPLRASVIRDYDRLPPEAQRLVRQYIDLLGKR